jgi:hypothetical protein
MFPKEHGAWNCLIIGLVAGWFALGHWNEAAGAFSVLWVSAFLIRGPWNHHRQYRGSDHPRSRRALALVAVLALNILACLPTAIVLAPGPCRWMLGWFGLPLGSILMILTVRTRSLRFSLAEVLGFLWITLLVPVTYLADPSHPLSKALWLWGLFGGYFLLAMAGIKVRQKWLEGSRKGARLSPADRFSQGWWVILLYALWVEGLGEFSGERLLWMAAPLYASLKTLAGIAWGRPAIPMMRLGFWEMLYSILFTVIWGLTWVS